MPLADALYRRAVPASNAVTSPRPAMQPPRLLVEAAWSYRFPARLSRELLLRQESQPKLIRDIAWKGNCDRGDGRRSLMKSGLAYDARRCRRVRDGWPSCCAAFSSPAARATAPGAFCGGCAL